MSSLLFIKTLLRSSEIFLPAWYETQWCKNFNFPDLEISIPGHFLIRGNLGRARSTLHGKMEGKMLKAQ